jgi:hypothetical protein
VLRLGLVDGFFFGTGLLNRFRFRTGLLEPVSFSNRFIQTGFYLGNRFNVNKKIISIKEPKLSLNLKYFWENWFRNCFFNKKPVRKRNQFNKRVQNGTGSNKPV